MWNDLQSELLNNRCCDVFPVSVLNYSLKTAELLAINLSSDGYIFQKQFKANDAFCVPPGAANVNEYQLLLGELPFFSVLNINVKTPFLVTSDNLGQSCRCC